LLTILLLPYSLLLFGIAAGDQRRHRAAEGSRWRGRSQGKPLDDLLPGPLKVKPVMFTNEHAGYLG
jgi:hypothetical protein